MNLMFNPTLNNLDMSVSCDGCFLWHAHFIEQTRVTDGMGGITGGENGPGEPNKLIDSIYVFNSKQH